MRRCWLRGARAGDTEVLIENLPGLPDGVSRGSDGRFWIALSRPRIPAIDAMLPNPWLRKVAYRLPFMGPPAVRHGLVLAIDTDGNVVTNLQHVSEDSFSPIASVQQHAGHLYLASFERDHLARLPLPPR